MTGRALIVEDTLSILEELCRIVSELVPEVHTADTVAAAQQLSSEFVFDLVLLDLGLQDGSGLELLEQLTLDRSGGRPLPRIIVVSSIMDIAVRQRVLELGARDLISKPFQPAEMRLRIQRVLERPRGDNTVRVPFQLRGTRLQVPQSGRVIRLRRRDARILSLLESNETRVFHLDVLIEWLSAHGTVREPQVIRGLHRLERILAAQSGRSGWVVELEDRRFRFRPGGGGD